MTNRRIVLARRPVGWVEEACFALEDVPEPQPGAQDVLVEAVYLSTEVTVLTARPARICAELPIGDLGPRDEACRVSDAFNARTRALHDLLHAAIRGSAA